MKTTTSRSSSKTGTKSDPRIDAYIEKAAAFAQPILQHFRQLVHQACPDVTETIKWGFPHFDYNGSILTSIAGFKQHCAVNFWKAAIMDDPDKILTATGETAMGHLGKITSLKELPADKILIKYLKQAAKLIDEGAKVPQKPKTTEKKELEIPADLVAALKKNKAAAKTFEEFSYSNKKEYTSWITEAKTEATRQSRIATAVEWMAEGKIRNWKYLKK
ncbi:uncharacterized protein YdeI (YjbR/CyaY-like superfamily) [Chitinophaga dinghuensis]|uniref:Uncharacterized protein YdeI (YjbR/CyaY-like superfamily) n=1 Tax=Chitinophaga dinghuensis TaxID=1539050 RepID=A0A327VZT8_9BACT|nr:YdeI/OmpD-associated family protein [Chitinophaga dinghuensis]RAJ80274.1 uncharacterized protein YdeI (YjbR/CyaY-like superfamily) [Chitinophaga dinghuensis]